jgi:hypothetical protein
MTPEAQPTSDQSFGRYASIGAFLDAYRVAERQETTGFLSRLSLQQRAEFLARPRNLADVQASLNAREPDDSDPSGGLHVRLLIRVLGGTVQNGTDPAVQADVQDCIATGRPVFTAIRTGDAMGIRVPIAGLDAGAALHLKGEWITREQAQSHGGEKLSVLHFTHHPVGFICTPVDCYS